MLIGPRHALDESLWSTCALSILKQSGLNMPLHLHMSCIDMFTTSLITLVNILAFYLLMSLKASSRNRSILDDLKFLVLSDIFSRTHFQFGKLLGTNCMLCLSILI